MGTRLRDDVWTSFVLLRSEAWVPVDLVAGLAGYVVWVAGSAALGVQLATLADYPVAPDGRPTTPILGLVALLWLVLPAAVGVARVRSRLLNIRGNVEQRYRLDRPAALLVPPVLLVAFVLIGGVAMGSFASLLFVALLPATLYLLVRTAAYAYRVFAFSRPVLVYVGLFATLVVQTSVLLVYFGQATGNAAVVTGAVDALGLPIAPLATTELLVFAAPTGLAVAAALPIGVALAYVLLQTLAGLLVRVRSPTIRPSRVRTGQRYPPGLDVASNGGRTATTRSGKQTPASKGADSSGADSTPSGSTTSSPSDTSAAGASATDHESTTASADDTTANDAAADTADADTAEAESVSHTRVFTPPDGTDDDPLSPTTGGDGTPCPDCGASVPEDADACPACGADAP